MRNWNWIKSFGLMLILVVWTSTSLAFEPTVSKHTLEENGLRVVVQEMPNNPMVSVYMLVKTGSATEGEYLGTGLSHFLEHMLFKGTERRGVGEISAEIQAVGGNLNASTSFDFTIYTINVPYKEFDVGLDVLADMIMNSTLDAEQIAKEREVVYNEMRLHRDNPRRYVSEMTFSTVYQRHPYQHTIIGYRDLLESVTRDDMLAYYKAKYIPNNMVLAVAGNIKTEEVMPKIQAAFKDFKREPYLLRSLPQEPDQIVSRRADEKFETKLTHLSLSFPSTSLLDKDLYALDVLAQILGQGQSSRLFQDLYKDKKLVQSISSGNYTPVDQGLFQISADLDDESKLDEVIAEILGHIEKVKEKGVTAEELNKAKKQVRASYINRNQTTGRVAWNLAYDEAFTGDFTFSRKYVDEVAKVTNEDIKRLARKYLTDQSLNTVVLHPKDSTFDSDLGRHNVESQAIQKEVLPNGMTLLTREDPTFDLVSIRLNLRGGTYEEPADLNGISSLTSDIWIKGTEKMNAEEIARFTDSRGIYLGDSSGKNSFGISLDCLSEDWEVCLDLLKDFVLTPSFPQEELELSKKSYRVALKQRETDIFRLAFHNLKQHLYKEHPLRLDTMGTNESLDRITRDDLKNFYDRLVVPENMVVSVYGNIDAEAVKNKITQDMGLLKGTSVELAAPTPEVLAASDKADVALEKQQAIVLFGFPAVDFKHPDYYKLDVMTSILGSPFSGRLFTVIRDQHGKAYTMGGNVAPSIDAGYIYLYVLTDPKDVDDVDALIRTEIKRIQSEVVDAKELESVKRYMKGSHDSGLQTNSQLNGQSSLNELYELGYNYHEQYPQNIEAVTAEDVQAVANQYLDLDKFVTVYVRPTTKE